MRVIAQWWITPMYLVPSWYHRQTGRQADKQTSRQKTGQAAGNEMASQVKLLLEKT